MEGMGWSAVLRGLSRQPLAGRQEQSGRAAYLHRLQHLLVRQLCLGSLHACCAERSLDYFVSIPFKLLIKK